MKLNQITILIALLIVFVSCSSVDNNRNTQSTAGGEKASAANMFDGYEELQGKDFENFKLPDKIEKNEFEKMYRFCSPYKQTDNDMEENRNVIKHFVGDTFDEKNLTKTNSYGAYLYSTPDIRIMVQYGYPISVDILDEALFDRDMVILGEYSSSESDKTVRLKNGECTLSELFEGMQKCLEKDLIPYYPELEFSPRTVTNYKNPKGLCFTKIQFNVKYNGIMIEELSPLFITENGPGYFINTFYYTAELVMYAAEKDSYKTLGSNFALRKIISEEVNEAISLKGAVELLRKELAPKPHYVFDSVALRYCCKQTAPGAVADPEKTESILADYGEIPTPYYEPTWCFYYTAVDDPNKPREAVKVNAVTGEITIDTAKG